MTLYDDPQGISSLSSFRLAARAGTSIRTSNDICSFEDQLLVTRITARETSIPRREDFLTLPLPYPVLSAEWSSRTILRKDSFAKDKSKSISISALHKLKYFPIEALEPILL